MSDPCQFCVAGSSFGAEKAQLVLYEGQWQPWPLAMARPDAPMIHCDVCPVCERERFNAEEVPRLNQKFGLGQRATDQEIEDDLHDQIANSGDC